VFRTWRKRFGDKTNLGSRTQLAKVIFGDLGYTSKGLNESGRGYKADEAAFDHVDLPFVKQYIQVEKLKKARNTYLAGIRREVDEKGLLHPFFNLNIAKSYRSSCDSPNFQNIPIRLEMLRDIIRRCFIPRKGHVIVEFDFKGIEVGVSCCYHHDPTLIRYVSDKENADLHGDTGQELFFMTKDQIKVNKLARHVAKNKFVFPQFYGDFYVSCARHIWEEMDKLGLKVDGKPMVEHLRANGITELGLCDPEHKPRPGSFEFHVKQVEDSFWNDRFPVYTEWKRRTWERYQKTGIVKFHTGFVAQGVYRRNQVLNFAIQGSAFHCLLKSLVKLQAWLVKYKMRTKIIGQIHDSLICDVHESELDEVITKAKQIMDTDIPNAWKWIIVPLDVEVEVAPPGKSWLDKGRWQNKDGTWQMKG
jgi:DNA polymerase I-like protein with 3'-5' exonuclease and polymerase domains